MHISNQKLLNIDTREMNIFREKPVSALSERLECEVRYHCYLHPYEMLYETDFHFIQSHKFIVILESYNRFIALDEIVR